MQSLNTSNSETGKEQLDLLLDLDKKNLADLNLTHRENMSTDAGIIKNEPPSYLKYVSLCLLTSQNAVLILVLRYARTRSSEDELFESLTAVIMSEVLKCLACFVITLFQEGTVKGWLTLLYKDIICEPMDCLKVSVPSLVYVLQNNLLYVAVSNLDAATFQVTYQLKILTTAIFSVALLKKVLSKVQWLGLLILFVGVAVVQMQPESSSKKAQSNVTQNPVTGLVAVIISSFMSGFAGVYFEKILKGTRQSVWLRNIQLGALGVVIGFITLYIKGSTKVSEKGFFHGFDAVVWFVVCCQSFGGLLVAVVVKYADNILKGFATSAAIILSCIASIYFFDFQLSLQFTFGSALVMLAVYIYNKFGVSSPSPIPQTRKM